MGRDNASQRILSPRRTTQGHDSSLKNTYGLTLLDGAQCFVLEEESNYRFLRHSELHADGKFVVEPIDHGGRWVRESGTFGVAILQNGKPQKEDPLLIGGYTAQVLVQFALSGSKLVYTGNAARLSCVAASSSSGHKMNIDIERGREWIPLNDLVVPIVPGDCLSMRLEHPADDAGTFSMVVSLA